VTSAAAVSYDGSTCILNNTVVYILQHCAHTLLSGEHCQVATTQLSVHVSSCCVHCANCYLEVCNRDTHHGQAVVATDSAYISGVWVSGAKYLTSSQDHSRPCIQQQQKVSVFQSG
jgi:hypothetical protein